MTVRPRVGALMPPRLTTALLFLTCVYLPGAMDAAPARACAVVPRAPGAKVSLGAEDVIIVWDAQAKRQHFIRRVQFDTMTSEFAFLVPTPSLPTLSETPEEVFGAMATAIAPREEVRREWQVGTCLSMMFLASADRSGVELGTTAAMGVRVVGTQRVAGLDASILQVRDAAALPH